MKIFRYILPLYLFTILLISCTKEENKITFPEAEVQDFIWKGLNMYYLWKDNVPNLDNSKDDDSNAYANYLNSYSDPNAFFESLIYDRENTDKWSWIVDDYIALENAFQGITTSNGVKYGLVYETGSSTDIFGYVKYILPNSNASDKNIKRGDVFDAINGTQLTVSNYSTLLANETYTLNLADLNNGNPTSNGTSVELSKSEYQTNPIYINETLEIDGKKIGYLMYNSFTSNYDQSLNTAFATIKSSGATELVLDLRYNGGGSVRTATYLSSMITGQFNGQLFTKEKWNNEVQQWFNDNHPEWLVNNFTNEILKTDSNGTITLQEAINSLNLTTVYVLTTESSASASELVINGLNPYINVITIGTQTHGKYVASITLYDSSNFGRDGANPNHTWAMQPIVLEEVNKLGENNKDGFAPTHEQKELISEMKPLGDVEEPLLAKAIALITGSGKTSITKGGTSGFKKIIFKEKNILLDNEMYVEKALPQGFKTRQ